MAGLSGGGVLPRAKSLTLRQPTENEALGTTREMLRESLGVLKQELEWSLGGRLDCISAQLGRLEDRLTASAREAFLEEHEHAQEEQPGPRGSLPGGSLDVPDAAAEDERSRASVQVRKSSATERASTRWSLGFPEAAVEDERARSLVQVRKNSADETASSGDASGIVFAVRAEWKFENDSADTMLPSSPSLRRTSQKSTLTHLRRNTRLGAGGEEGALAIDAPQWILRPSGRARRCWDLFCLALIAYDTVMVPFTVAFQPDESPFMRFMLYLAIACWTVDIPLNFATGCYVDGVEELRLKQIALAYLRGWFALDLLVVGVEYVELIVAGDSKGGVPMIQSGKTIRSHRLLRALRLFRFVRMQRIVQDLQDRLRSEYAHILISMFKPIAMIILLNHLIACAWYGIGFGQSSDAWVKHFFDEDGSDLYAYFTSLHWSLTQFTPASVDIVPKNVYERVFNVLLLVFALVVLSSFLSSVTAHMTCLRNLNGSCDNDMSMLRRYLCFRGIPRELSLRILRYAEHQVQREKQEVQESRVHLLKMLSKPLLMELEMESYAPTLIQHPFFRWYAERDPGAMKQLCNSALSCILLSTGDTVYTESSRCNRMFFLRRGRLVYVPHSVQGKMRLSSGNDMVEHVEVGGWCCEAALWTQWVHFGRARAIKDSEIIAVDALVFSKVSCNHRKVARSAALYGAAFVERLNQQAVSGELSDLPDGKLVALACLSHAIFGGRPSTLSLASADEDSRASTLPHDAAEQQPGPGLESL